MHDGFPARTEPVVSALEQIVDAASGGFERRVAALDEAGQVGRHQSRSKLHGMALAVALPQQLGMCQRQVDDRSAVMDRTDPPVRTEYDDFHEAPKLS